MKNQSTEMPARVRVGTFPELNDKVRAELAIRCGHDDPAGIAQWSLGFDAYDLRNLVTQTMWVGQGGGMLDEAVWGVVYMVALDLIREGFIHPSAKLKTPTKKRPFIQCFPMVMETTRAREKADAKFGFRKGCPNE